MMILFYTFIAIATIVAFYGTCCNNKLSTKKRVILVIIAAINLIGAASSIFYAEHLEWKNEEFEGTIEKVSITDNRAVREYTINNAGEVVVIFDDRWKLSDFKEGDHITKHRGSSEVNFADRDITTKPTSE